MDNLFTAQQGDASAFSAFDSLSLNDGPPLDTAGASNFTYDASSGFDASLSVSDEPIVEIAAAEVEPQVNGHHATESVAVAPSASAAGPVKPTGGWTRTRWSEQGPLARLTDAAGLVDSIGGHRLVSYSNATLRPALSPSDRRRVALLAQLAQMELLLRKESLLSTIPNATPELAQELAEAIDKVLETAETELERSGESNSLTEYMDSHKLCSLYPRTAERLGCTTAPSAMTPTSPYSNPGDLPSHLAKMNLLNQCIGMGTQLYKDVNGLRNHKYLAHQIALLYQSLSQLSQLSPSTPIFSTLQNRIREKFDAVKQQCSTKSLEADSEEAIGPMLSPDLVEWLSALSNDVVSQLLFTRHGSARLPVEGDGFYTALYS